MAWYRIKKCLAISLISSTPDPWSLDFLHSALSVKFSNETIMYKFLHHLSVPREHGSKLSGLFHLRPPFSFWVQPGAFAVEQPLLCFSWNLWIGLALILISHVLLCKTLMLPTSQIEQFCLNIYKLPSTPGHNPLLLPAAPPQFLSSIFS